MDELDHRLHLFVSEVCANRDASHGLQHMQRVAILTDQLIMNTNDIDDFHGCHPDKVRYLAKLVAWLHDVDDHKYTDGTHIVRDKMMTFLASLDVDTDTIHDIMTTIKYISYSQQIRTWGEDEPDWSTVLPAYMIPVRHFVSDADKIEALGAEGVKRCLDYSRHKYPEGDDIFHIRHLVTHHKEKLSKIASRYIYTAAGKVIARREQELMDVSVDMLARSIAAY